MELQKGTTLQTANYTIERTLGRGGFGITYMAFQSSLQRRVAIKEFFMKDYCSRNGDIMIIPDVASLATVNSCKNKFINEARIVAELNNAHIVRIYDVFEENNTAYYVMELLERGSLKDMVESIGPLGEETALEYIGQVSEALYHIHAKGLLHLDIKPDNIMLNQYKQAVLIDFGVSRHFDNKSNDITTTTLGVTDGYSPLEQYISDGINDLNQATDIYSLGATLLYLLTGTKPSKAGNVNGRDHSALPSGISSKVKKALQKAMNPTNKDRFQDICSFAKALGIEIYIPQPINDNETIIINQKKGSDQKTYGSSKPLRNIIIGVSTCLLVAAGCVTTYCVIKTGEKKNGSIPTEVQNNLSTGKVQTPAEEVQKEESQPKNSVPMKTNKEPASSSSQSRGTIDYGYAIYSGKMKNGVPDGIGSLTFKQQHIIDARDPQKRMAETGDYIKDGDFKDGHLVQGNLFSSSGEKKGFILIGG